MGGNRRRHGEKRKRGDSGERRNEGKTKGSTKGKTNEAVVRAGGVTSERARARACRYGVDRASMVG
jgi:hypothetical protein